MARTIRSALARVLKRDIVWGDWLAPALILVTPFVNFLIFHDYSLIQPESLLAIAVLAGLGLAGSLLMTSWPRVALPFLPWPVMLRPLVIATAMVFFFDFQPELKKPVIALISRVFSDGARCVPCIISFFVLIFVLFFAVAHTLKRNATTVFATIFTVMLAATIILPQTAEGRRVIREVDIPSSTTEPRRSDLPPIVHIVLDEQIGIDGMPANLPGGADLRYDLLKFYVDNGFRVYGRAFSKYHNTGDSLSNLVNGVAQPREKLFMSPSGQGFTITENAWFGQLTAQGYRIHIYQTDYLDFCDNDYTIVRCLSTPATGLAIFQSLEIAIAAKVVFILHKYSEPSSFFGFGYRLPFYLRNLRPSTQIPLEAAPDRWRLPGLGAAWAKITAERLTEDLREIEPGNAYFAHLLLPHRGFILDEDCRLKPDLDSWYDYPHLGLRSERLARESRRARYIEYFRQVHCTRRLISNLLNALSQSGFLDDAIVIIHGDHGSRISGLTPSEAHASRLTNTDLTDSFSVLFAIRSPNLPAGYDSSVRSIQALFADLVFGRPFENERKAVFLIPKASQPDAPLVEFPFSGFDRRGSPSSR